MHPAFKKPRLFVALLTALALVSGCGSDSRSESSPAMFWDALNASDFMEVDPPHSFAELTAKSPLIVVGQVTDFEVWEETSEVDAQTGHEVKFPLLTLQVAVTETLKGDSGAESLEVILAGSFETINLPAQDHAKALPDAALIFFLKPAERADSPGAYVLASELGLWGDAGEGEPSLVPVRDRGLAPNVVPAGVVDVAGVRAALAQLEG